MEIKTYVLSSMAKVFLDEEPKNYIQIKNISAFKNEKAGFQLALISDENLYDVTIEASEGLKAFKVLSVPSVKPVDGNGDDYYLRKTPGLYPDVLRPYEGEGFNVPMNTCLSFYFEAENMSAGVHQLEIKVINGNGEAISTDSLSLEIIDCQLPEQSLIYTNWFHCDSLATFYKVPVFSEEFWKITESFVKTAASHSMNFILTPLFTPPLDTKIGTERLTVQLVGVKKTADGYEFDFSNLKRWIDMCKNNGIKYFEMSHLFTQWGALHAPKVMAEVDGETKRIFGWETDSTGEEYKEFLSSLAPVLTEFLENEGIADNCYFHVSDEPGEKDLEVYGKLSCLMNELFGKRFKIIDALSDFKFYEKGYVSLPIPCEEHIEEFAGKVPELWTYYCCGPRDRYYSNRFFSMPLQRTRILGMQMYKYGVKGFLHWGYNFYFTQLAIRPVDPFAETDADCAFSSGDAFIVYPAPDATAWASLRLKAINEAVQDMRALQLLETLAGKNKVMEILEDNYGEKYDLTFTDYPRSEKWHFEKREEINAAIKALI